MNENAYFFFPSKAVEQHFKKKGKTIRRKEVSILSCDSRIQPYSDAGFGINLSDLLTIFLGVLLP